MQNEFSFADIRWRRCLSNHNPLYLVSAWLVLLGVSQAFRGEVGLRWIPLMTQLLCGYTVAIAVAGWLVVRIGKVWDDARMILLVVLLMFTALSTSYDDLCLKDPTTGALHLGFGYCFSCVTSEIILIALGMKLPLRYRVPFYLQLAVLFAFPAILGRLSVAGNDPAMCAGVLLFPVTAGAALLALWPSAFFQHERDYGTPWPWPLYPWSIFVFVAVASAIRAWMLSVSFSPAAGVMPAFLPYLWCPILLAMIFLLLELGLQQNSKTAQRIALFSLFGVLWMAFPRSETNAAQSLLLDLLESEVAGPPLVLCGAAVLIALYGMLRGAAAGELVFVVSTSLLACLRTETRSWAQLASPNLQILVLLVAWQFSWGIATQNMPRLVVAGVGGLILAALQFDFDWMFVHHWFWLIQLSALWCILLPLVCRDRLARVLRSSAPFWITVLVTLTMILAPIIRWSLPPWLPAAIASTLVGVALLYGVVLRVRWFALPAGWAAALACCGWAVLALNSFHDMQLRRGLAIYAGGCSLLVVALAYSFWKAGIVQRAWTWLQSHAPPPNSSTPVSSNPA